MNAHEARALLENKKHGVLSTLSTDPPGHPFGSFVTYCLDGRGCPLLFLSEQALHTQHLRKNPNVSLTAVEIDESDIQNSARVTVLAEAVQDHSPETMDLYFKRFPEARAYKALDFLFFRLEPVKIRYIGGFGTISWITPEEYFQKRP